MAAQPPTQSAAEGAAAAHAAATTPAARAAARPAASPAVEQQRVRTSIIIGAILTLLLVAVFLGGMLAVTVVNLMNTPQLPLG